MGFPRHYRQGIPLYSHARQYQLIHFHNLQTNTHGILKETDIASLSEQLLFRSYGCLIIVIT